MGRYATREEELDQMLRGKLFVDLYQVVRHGIRAGVESYSIKRLEPLYAYSRDTALPDANAALALLQASIELDDISSVSDQTKATVLAYNRDDCNSAAVLRDWLEGLREQIACGGTPVPRPEPGDSAPNEKITDWLIRIKRIGRFLARIDDRKHPRTRGSSSCSFPANIRYRCTGSIISHRTGLTSNSSRQPSLTANSTHQDTCIALTVNFEPGRPNRAVPPRRSRRLRRRQPRAACCASDMPGRPQP